MPLADLYQEILLDHYRKPRNTGEIEEAEITVRGSNPLCGDEITLYLKLEGERVSDVKFQGLGCAISQASCSMMTEKIKGKRLAELLDLAAAFRKVMTGEKTEIPPELEEAIETLKGVIQFPIRVKCANMGWITLQDGIKNHQKKTN